MRVETAKPIPTLMCLTTRSFEVNRNIVQILYYCLMTAVSYSYSLLTFSSSILSAFLVALFYIFILQGALIPVQRNLDDP